MLRFLFLLLSIVFAIGKSTPSIITSIDIDSYLGHWLQVYQAPTNVIFQGYGTCLTHLLNCYKML